jgi:hypothetical protein
VRPKYGLAVALTAHCSSPRVNWCHRIGHEDSYRAAGGGEKKQQLAKAVITRRVNTTEQRNRQADIGTQDTHDPMMRATNVPRTLLLLLWLAGLQSTPFLQAFVMMPHPHGPQTRPSVLCGSAWPLRTRPLGQSPQDDDDDKTSNFNIHREEQLPSSLPELLQALDVRNVRYRPSTTRAELEDLWRKDQAAALANEKATAADVSVSPMLSQDVTLGDGEEEKSSSPSPPITAQAHPVENNDTDEHSSVLSATTTADARGEDVPRTTAAQPVASIASLLTQLDDREIRYAPRATRAQLQALLVTQPASVLDDPQAPSKSPVSSRKSENVKAATTLANESAPTIRQVTRETALRDASSLDPPVAQKPSRRMETTVKTQPDKHQEVDDEVAMTMPKAPRRVAPLFKKSNQMTASASLTSADAESLSLATLLQSLDEREIRYSTRATRQDLETLWNESNDRIARRGTAGTSGPRTPATSLQSIRSANDEEDSMRADRQRKEEMTGTEKAAVTQDTEEDLSRRRQERRESRRMVREEAAPAYKKVLRTGRESLKKLEIPEAVSQTKHKVTRKARQVTRQAKDLWAVDEDGVRDASFSYVSKETPAANDKKTVIEVEAERIRRRPKEPTWTTKPVDSTVVNPEVTNSGASTYNRSPGVKSSPTESRPLTNPSYPAQSPTSTSRTTKRPRPATTPKPNFQTTNAGRSQAATSRLWSSSDTPRLALRRSNAEPSIPKKKKKRIYSPYTSDRTFDDSDALDRFGTFMADMADRVMWGKYDDDTAAPGTPKNTTTAHRETHSRHWKDRMEERMDSLLGIHQNGRYYDSWMRNEDKDRLGEEGTDAFAYARGRAKKRRKKGSDGHDKPLWEEEGNFVSLLFGRSFGGQKLSFDDAIDGEPGQLLRFARIFFRTFLVGSSYACRWASVRGSIPQPLVVMGISTAAICVRRHRIQAVFLTLIAMRTIGEFIHSQTVGDEGWDQDDQDDGEMNDGEMNDEVHPASA